MDENLAEAIRRECEFFAQTAEPRPGYDGPGMADIRTTRVSGLHGDVLATLFSILKDGSVTFFDIPFTPPRDDPYG